MSSHLHLGSSFRVLAFVALASIAIQNSSAQCVDWSDGYGAPSIAMNGYINATTIWDDGLGGGPALYAGGGFTQAGGVPANSIARWDGASWHPLGLGFDNEVTGLCSFDDGFGSMLCAGGYFHSADGAPAIGVAVWDGSSWSSICSSFAGVVQCMASYDDGSGAALFVGGSISNINGVAVHNLAKWQNGVWSSVGGGANAAVRALLVSSLSGTSELYACGDFSQVGGNVAAGRIAKWNGSSWSTLPNGPNGNGTFSCLTMFDDGSGPKLYVGGLLSYLNNQPISLVASWNGSTWAPVGSVQGGGSTSCMTVFDDGSGPGLYMAGSISHIGPLFTYDIAEWKGGSWHALGMGMQSTYQDAVRSLQSWPTGSNSKLYVAGDFKLAGGKPAIGFARWGDPCLPPSIVQQPESQSTVFPLANQFSIVANGLTPMTYQWRHNGSPIVDTGPISGAKTNTLLLTQWTYGDDGLYDCVVTNALGTVASDKAKFTVAVPPGFGGPVTVQPVLVPPLQVPNLPPGILYDHAYDANTGSDGSVAALASLNTGDFSMSQWQSGQLANLVRTNDPAPGTGPGVYFSSFLEFEEAVGGQLSFGADLGGTGVAPTNHRGIWYRDSSGTDLVVRAGDQVPGLPAGQLFYEPVWPRLNNNGVVSFFSLVYTGNTYVSEGVWAWTRAAGLQLVALRGMSAPGTSAHFVQFDHTTHPVLDTGEVQVLATLDTLTGYHVYGTSDAGVWLGSPGNLRLELKCGDPAPGMPANANLDSILDCALASDGSSYVRATVAGPSGALGVCLYRASLGIVSPVVLYGDSAPTGSPTATFANPTAFSANANGDVLIDSDTLDSCPTCPTKGVFVKNPSGIHMLATNHADPLPSIPPNMPVQNFDTGSINGSGWVIFHVTLFNGYSAVYGWTKSSGLFPIAVPGTQLEIAPGVFQTVSGCGFSGEVAGASPLAHSHELTDDGRFTIWVYFWTGGTAELQGQFQVFLGASFGPGTAFCFGDGSGTPCPCANSGAAGEGCANSKAHGTVLNALGSVSVSDDSLRFDASGLPFHKSTLLFQAPNQAAGGNGFAFGDGLLCVGGQIKRIGLVSSDANGFASFGPGLSAFAQWSAGQTRCFQVWYRDSNGPCASGTNLSNAYQVTFVP